MMITRFWIAAGLAAIAAACGGKSSDAPGSASGSGAPAAVVPQDPAPEDEPDPAGDGPPKRAALTADRLAPILHPVALPGVAPTSIAIEVGVPIIDQGMVGSTTEKSVLKITPEVRGSLRYTSMSGLAFVPAAGLEPDTDYKVELLKLETRDGVLEPPAGKRWERAIKTPKLALLGWAPGTFNAAGKAIAMEVAFSAPVFPHIALGALDIRVNGKKPAGVGLGPTPNPSTIVLTVSDPAIAVGAKLTLGLTRPLPAVSGAQLQTASAEHVISAAKTVSIKAAGLVEGATGFYVEVVCHDTAAPSGYRSSYDFGTYTQLSQRCQLSEDALDKVSFDPPVKQLSIAPARAGFRIFGSFKRGAYALKIDAGAVSVDGGVVQAPFARSFVVSSRKPQLAFGASGRYLPRSAWTNLAIKHLNVDAVNVVVRQVPPQNLVFWLGGPDAADERTADLILKKTVPLRSSSDELATTWIDMAALLPATATGVLEVKVIGLGARATSRIMLTNLSLVAKKTSPPQKPWEQHVQVWALGMDTAALVDGVEVSLVRRSGKVVARCTTSGGDGCRLATNSATDPDRGEPFAVIARKGADLTYLRYEDLRATVAESSTSGLPYTAPDTPYRAAVFADRGVYRPGDTAHVVAIVRDAKDRAPAQPVPVEIKVIDPRAKVARKLTLTTNASGVLALDYALAPFADTGHWRVLLAIGDKPLASHSLQVEEIVPERMRVTAVAKTKAALAGEPIAVDVSASYLFGGSAIDSGVELTCAVEPERFVPEENADLVYGVEPKGRAVTLGASRDQLDARGNATISCPPAPAGATFTQTVKLTATAAVLEAGSGRATVRTTEAMVHPEKFYIGLRTSATRAAAGEAFTVEGLLVDWQGQPAPRAAAQVEVELLALEADHGYGYDEESGEARYDRWLRAVREGKQVAAVTGGKFSLAVTPGSASAGYLVRVRAGAAKTELVLDGDSPWEYYGYGDGERSDQTPRPARPTQLVVKVPSTVEVGKAVAVTVKTPYRGRILWTVETDRVIAAEWRDATGAEAAWSFQLPTFAPNVYVSAFLVKDPHLESKVAFLPDRAFGISSARVTPTQFTQPLTLTAPKEIRSASALEVTLDVGAQPEPTVATVAVVDEGLLSLTSFATPDPLAQLFAKRALGVETYETIGWTMLHKPAGASSHTGGGADEEGGADGSGAGSGRVQAVKPVALFSGIVPVGADGKVKIPFQVPQYRGQLRVMAFTASATRVGRAEARVTVRDPLVVQTTFPRFLTQDDQVQIPVFLTNVSGGPLQVSVSISSAALPIPGIAAPAGAPPPLAFAGKATGTAQLADGRAETLVFDAKAVLPIGGAKLRVVATATGRAGTFTVTDELDVPFLPAGPTARTVSKVRVEAGKLDLTAQPALKDWVPTSETTTFWLTANPYSEAFEHLRYVVHYPYGCLEQTTSSTRPLLYLGELAEQLDPKLGQTRLTDMVQAGIARVLSMETPAGGLGYWPGATEPEEWATAYATHMLIDAKRAGYAVPDDRLAGILAWIDGRVSLRERGGRIHANRWGNYDEQAEAYLHYTLALAGKGKKARIARLIAAIPPQAKGELAEGLYMLKAALYLAGDRRYERDLRAVDASPIAEDRSNGWSFYSDRRRRGFMLSTFFDLFKNDPAGEALAQRVAIGLTGERSSYYNTQEIVWGVTGLGKWVAAMTARGAAAAGTLTAGGKVVAPRRAPATAKDRTWTVARASEQRELALDVPASAAGMWLVATSEGVRAGGDYPVGGKGLAVARTYRKLDGTVVDLAAGGLRLGDLVFVELTVENTSGAWIQNVALVDRLPAGFEIENPRLGRSSPVSWITAEEVWATDFMNMRDDRITAFGSLAPRQSRKLVYTARAVTSGTFTLPPVEAEAMYDPALWARAKGGTAVVGGPWTGKTL
jgi:hypothetical protein